MGIIIKRIKKEEAWKVRHKVMWPDKEFAYIKLADDDIGIHLGLFKNNQLISVISLFIENKEAQFRKFATLTKEQGKGYGSALLNHSLNHLENHGVKRIWCNARTDKIGFYQKFGLEETNATFTRGGKFYVIMVKNLSTIV